MPAAAGPSRTGREPACPRPPLLGQRGVMRTLTRVVLIAVLVAVVVGVTVLAVWDIPPPVARVEKVLPDERFPR